ncbi:hypothetical protein QUB68_11620 [Microcoleus sp. A006_D1]|uniref:hypothetical protein n=1 Tax=Microcoleus sp. A006_D1 TaxID=3055267 RepID=UPI002FD5CB9D
MSINDYDWQKIETFDEKIKSQEMLALEVYEIVGGFVRRFGKKTSDYEVEFHDGRKRTVESQYKDDVVDCSCRYSEGDTYINNSITIRLVPSGKEVFSVMFTSRKYARDSVVPHRDIHCFRLGSWLNHIESLRLKLEPIEKAEEKAKEKTRKEKEAREREQRFGRLD